MLFVHIIVFGWPQVAPAARNRLRLQAWKLSVFLSTGQATFFVERLHWMLSFIHEVIIEN
jgi:hypothetical protein